MPPIMVASIVETALLIFYRLTAFLSQNQIKSSRQPAAPTLISIEGGEVGGGRGSQRVS